MPSLGAFTGGTPVALALLGTRFVLVAVFTFAGLAKLFNPTASRQAITAFGVPGSLVRPLSVLLPTAELLVAVLLVPARSAQWGAAGALGLLLMFLVAISVNLVQGRNPDCQCFGQVHSRPIGWSTLARNTLLAVCAGLSIWAGRPRLSAWGWLADGVVGIPAPMWIFAAGSFSILIVELFLLLHLFRQHGRVLLRMDRLEQQLAASGALVPAVRPEMSQGLAIGVRAPSFQLSTMSGMIVGLETLLRGYRALVMIFTDPTCEPCAALWPAITRWQRDAGTVRIVVVSKGFGRANATVTGPDTVSDMLLQQEREIAELYAVPGTPGAVLIRDDGTIGSAVAMGAAAIASLVTGAMDAQVAGVM
jgi:hypothetical protein